MPDTHHRTFQMSSLIHSNFQFVISEYHSVYSVVVCTQKRETFRVFFFFCCCCCCPEFINDDALLENAFAFDVFPVRCVPRRIVAVPGDEDEEPREESGRRKIYLYYVYGISNNGFIFRMPFAFPACANRGTISKSLSFICVLPLICECYLHLALPIVRSVHSPLPSFLRPAHVLCCRYTAATS